MGQLEQSFPVLNHHVRVSLEIVSKVLVISAVLHNVAIHPINFEDLEEAKDEDAFVEEEIGATLKNGAKIFVVNQSRLMLSFFLMYLKIL